MFEGAHDEAARWTWPVVDLYRPSAGNVGVGLGPFVLVNRDGWFVTSGHTMSGVEAHREMHIDAWGEPFIWWGADGLTLAEGERLEGCDLFVGRLEPFEDIDLPSVAQFIRPSEFPSNGRLLCSFGYKRSSEGILAAFYDEEADEFRSPATPMKHELWPVTGPLSAVGVGEKLRGGVRHVKMVLSCHVFPGHSGGPVVDPDGTVYGIPVEIAGFRGGSRNSQEGPPFVITRAVHAFTVTSFLEHLGVEYHFKPTDRKWWPFS